MSWQELARDGERTFATVDELQARTAEVEQGLNGLCTEVARVAAQANISGLERARSLRSKPADGEKSLYECLNQLIHYWYCCKSGEYLLRHGYGGLHMRPTAVDSRSDKGSAFDIEALHPQGLKVVGEVFCVSPSLWENKKNRTLAKLQNTSPTSVRIVFYNREVKQKYQTKSPNVWFFGIDSNGEIRRVCTTDVRILPGLSD